MRGWLDIAALAMLGCTVVMTVALAVNDRGVFLDAAQADAERAARYISDRANSTVSAAQRSAERLGEVGIRQHLSGMRGMELQDHVDVVARALEFYAGYELVDRAGVKVLGVGHLPDPVTSEPGSKPQAQPADDLRSAAPDRMQDRAGAPRANRATGMTLLPVAAPMHDAQGRLLLYSIVYLDAQALSRAFANHLPAVDRMRAVDSSGRVLLSWPLQPEGSTLTLPAVVPPRCALQDAADMALCARAGAADSGLSVVIERSVARMLAEWYRDLVFYALIGTLALAALVLFLVLRHRDRRTAREREASALSLGMFESGILVFGANRTLLFCNPAAHDLLGIPGKFVVRGMGFVSICEAIVRAEGIEDPAEHKQRLDALLQDWERLLQLREVERRTATGRRLRFARADNAEGVSALMITDVTASSNQAEELTVLRQMDEVAQITAGASHDFNNTLTAIGGQVDLGRELLREGKHAEAERRLDLAIEAIARGAKIVRILLGFSRVDRTRIEQLDVCDLLRQRGNSLAGLAGRRSGYRQVIPADAHWVQVDAAGLSSVVENLVVNARDAMPEGGLLNLTVSRQFVRTERRVASGDQLRPGNYVRIDIADTGSGIDEATLEKIFQPFFTTKPKHAGSGLGLAQARSYCRLHRGAIDVSTSPGSGTTMMVWLPESVAPALGPGNRTAS